MKKKIFEEVTSWKFKKKKKLWETRVIALGAIP